MPHRTIRDTSAVWAAIGALLLGGCGAVGPSPTDPGAAGSATRLHVPASPTTLDNCGHPVELGSPPQRIVTVKSSALETVLALGLGDRVVGAAFLDGPVPAAYADAAASIDVIADRAPGAEATLALEPDLVWSGWESTFSADAVGDRAALESLGVATYVSPSACKEPGYQPDPLTFDDVFAEIEEAGTLLGAQAAARDLVAEQREALAAVTPDTRGLTALWYSSGTDTPYVGAGIGAPQMLMEAVGLTNIAGGVHDTWTSYGWEQVAVDDPDVIVLVDATWNTADHKIAALESNPATAGLTAVREQRYVIVPFAATEAGVRNVAAAADLSRQLAALGMVR